MIGPTNRFAAGRATDAPAEETIVHAIDGDGASLCERVAPETLVHIDSYSWPDILERFRCPACTTTFIAYGAGS